MATIPSRRAGDESPAATRRRIVFNPLESRWPVGPRPWSPLAAAAGASEREPAITPGKPVTYISHTQP